MVMAENDGSVKLCPWLTADSDGLGGAVESQPAERTRQTTSVQVNIRSPNTANGEEGQRTNALRMKIDQ
jgi:hypothetical protein